MQHLIFWIYILSLSTVIAAIVISILLYLQFKKKAIKYYILFLSSLLLNLITLIITIYKEIAGLGNSLLIQYLVFINDSIAGFAFILITPLFFHYLIGIPLTKTKIIAFILFSISTTIFRIVHFIEPSPWLVNFLLLPLSYGVAMYAFIIGFMHLKNIANKMFEKILKLFMEISILLVIILLVSDYFFKPFYHRIFKLPIPIYFLIISGLSIIFSWKFFKDPPYQDSNKLTDQFTTNYQITKRESEVISLLMEGNSNKDIAEQLSIASKTVDNHISNIYKKTRVKNRLQLLYLIQKNPV